MGCGMLGVVYIRYNEANGKMVPQSLAHKVIISKSVISAPRNIRSAMDYVKYIKIVKYLA